MLSSALSNTVAILIPQFFNSGSKNLLPYKGSLNSYANLPDFLTATCCNPRLPVIKFILLLASPKDWYIKLLSCLSRL